MPVLALLALFTGFGLLPLKDDGGFGAFLRVIYMPSLACFEVFLVLFPLAFDTLIPLSMYACLLCSSLLLILGCFVSLNAGWRRFCPRSSAVRWFSSFRWAASRYRAAYARVRAICANIIAGLLLCRQRALCSTLSVVRPHCCVTVHHETKGIVGATGASFLLLLLFGAMEVLCPASLFRFACELHCCVCAGFLSAHSSCVSRMQRLNLCLSPFSVLSGASVSASRGNHCFVCRCLHPYLHPGLHCAGRVRLRLCARVRACVTQLPRIAQCSP